LKVEGFRSRCCGFKLATAGKGVQMCFMVINVLFQGFLMFFNGFGEESGWRRQGESLAGRMPIAARTE
jgi:hypothetical protein